MTEYNNLILEKTDKVLKIIINRPKALNALNMETLNEISSALRDDTKDCRVVILTGSGEKAFIAGSDILEMSEMNALEFRHYSEIFMKTISSIRRLKKPVIAAVNGMAFGGGNVLALSCDFVLATEDALFGQQEINVGIFGGASFLMPTIGRVRATEVVFTGRTISAKEAKDWGLINKIVSKDKLDEEVNKIAQTLLSRPPLALAFAKEAINNNFTMPSDVAVDYEQDLLCLCFDTEDQKEGMKAFLERRRPVYKGL